MLRRELIEQAAELYEGIPIWGCLPGSPAERAGLRAGDIVLTVNGRRTESLSTFLAAREWKDGRIVIRIVRDGSELELVLEQGDWQAPSVEQVAVDAAASRAFAPSSASRTEPS